MFKCIEAEKHMKKKITVFTLCAVLLTFGFPLEAQQQATKVPRIGFLGSFVCFCFLRP